jgi:hypothetical protein
MEKTTLDTRNEALKELFNGTSFECYQYAGFETADELIESLREEINEDQVIYYSNAMKYLMEHDGSLMESLGLAHDLGYTADKINSELLATLLQQQNMNEELGGMIEEIENLFAE